MKQTILALSVLLAVAFTACNQTAKQDTQSSQTSIEANKNAALIASFKALTDKSAQLQASLDNADDQDSAVKQEYDELQVEIANFIADNQAAIAKLSADEQAVFVVR